MSSTTIDTAFAKWGGVVLTVLLIVVASIQDDGLLDAATANTLSVALILAGVLWTLRGPDKLRRLGELYLWLAFIVSVSLLRALTDSWAARTGSDTTTTFQVAAVGHLLIVVGALWALGAWTPRSEQGSLRPYAARLAAGLLIAGAVIFWIGARTFPGMSLDAVSQNLRGHSWTAGCFAAATLVTLVGLGLLTSELRAAGDRLLSLAAFCTFFFGSVFWILHLAFRLTVQRAVAEEYSRTGAAPAWFSSWSDWAGVLFGIFSVLAYVSVVTYGVAILRTRFVPRWVGWVCILLGLLFLPQFGPPLFIHVLLWLVGLFVLRPPETGEPASTPAVSDSGASSGSAR